MIINFLKGVFMNIIIWLITFCKVSAKIFNFGLRTKIIIKLLLYFLIAVFMVIFGLINGNVIRGSV